MPMAHFDGSFGAWVMMAALIAIVAAVLWLGQMVESPALTGLGAAGLVLAVLWAGPVFAAQIGEDLEALAARAKARGEESAKSLAPWVAALKDPSAAAQGDAAAIGASAEGALRRGAERLDDPFLRGALASAGQAAAAGAPGPVYVAVSLSMPAETLRALGKDADKAGVRLVLRGLVQGSFKETAVRVRQVFDQHSAGGVAIDPKVFRAFGVIAAPTFVAATADVEPCGALGCTPEAPGYDKVSGNISLEAALTVLAGGGGPGAPAAAAALKRLRS